jgi:hypothetical protein
MSLLNSIIKQNKIKSEFENEHKEEFGKLMMLIDHQKLCNRQITIIPHPRANSTFEYTVMQPLY